jgi:protein arginine N-methyltransferase 3
MSFQLKGTVEFQPEESTHDSSEEDLGDDDDNWDDWVSDSLTQLPCKSLFDDSTFPSAEEVIQYDQTEHSFNLDQICNNLCMCLSPFLIFLFSCHAI